MRAWSYRSSRPQRSLRRRPVPFSARPPSRSIEPSQWALIAILGSFGTAVPFTAFLIAAEINPASRLGVSGYLVPVVAVTLAVIFLDETITLTVLAGAALIVGGVILTERATKHVPEPGIVTAQ